jgi:erythromycin esterase
MGKSVGQISSAEARVLGRLEGEVYSVAFFREGGAVAAADSKGNICVWDLAGNTIESLNATLRKLLHYRGHFPTDEAATKLLYLALTNIEKKWERSVRDWSNVLGQFAVFFKDRLPALETLHVRRPAHSPTQLVGHSHGQLREVPIMLRRVTAAHHLLLLLVCACTHSSTHGGQAEPTPCHGELVVQGLIGSRNGPREVPYAGATVAIIRVGSNEAAALVSSGRDGRFVTCLPPGQYSVTATAPEHAPFYQAPSTITTATKLHIVLRMGGVAFAGTIVHHGDISAYTHVRMTRISNEIGDVFYTAVQPDGRFSTRLLTGFEYRIDVVGGMVSPPRIVRIVSEQTGVNLTAFSRERVESPPGPAVVRWMRQAVMPLRPDVPVGASDDWRTFSAIIGEAKVVALGENTHGAGSFAEMRNRLAQASVTHLAFNVVAIEGNFTEALAINDYVVNGRGDPKKALAGLHFWVSDNEQMSELIEWIRRYNADPAHRRKVKFYGIDMQYSRAPYEELIHYLEVVDRSVAAQTAENLKALASDDDAPFEKLPREQKHRLCDQVGRQISALDKNRFGYVETAGSERWRLARQNAVVLSQACRLNLGTLNDNDFRDNAMAENVRWILDTEGADTRVLLWAHNAHVATSDSWSRPMGHRLRVALGKGYLAIGQFFNRGSFRAWDLREKEDRQSVVPIQMPAAPSGYLEAAFARIGLPAWAMDLRRAPREGEVWRWLTIPHPSRDIGATYLDEESSRTLSAVVDQFDALVFIEKIFPTRPNPTGLRGPNSR